jgi:aspartate aminotransferase
VIGELNRIPEFKTRIPEGAFYIFVNCAGVIGRKTPEGTVISSDRALAEYVLFKTGVAVVPGSAFGLKPYLRISYAASTADLREACRRIEVVVATLST